MSAETEYQNENNWTLEEFKNIAINCGRTIKRFLRTMVTLAKKPNESIAAASENKAEAKAIYALIDNSKVNEEVVLSAHKQAVLRRIKESGEKVILSIQDTSELNYTSHKKTAELGSIGSLENSRGLIMHSAIAATPEGITFGLLYQKIWARDPEERGKSKKKSQRPIEEKESYKWIEGMTRNSQEMIDGVKFVNVCDREADVFEFFHQALEWDQSFLVRVVHNRNTDEAIKLFDKINNEKAAGEIVVEIPRDTRRNIKSRTTTLELKYAKVRALTPNNLHKKFGKDGYVEFNIILAKEITTPEGNQPIEWYLVTDIEISSFDEAMEKVKWYIQRWKIERFHYVLKSGCEVEELQAREASRLKKLILMYSIIALRILSITYLARQNPESSCEEILEEDEWRVLYCIANKTSVPPQIAPTIKEAVSYIAKLGGFLGRKGDGEPGAKVIWKGMKELNIVLQHYKYLIPN